MRAKYEAQLKTDLSEVYTQLDNEREAHEALKCNFRQLVERMELIGNNDQWSGLDRGYKQASKDWAFEVKKILNTKPIG